MAKGNTKANSTSFKKGPDPRRGKGGARENSGRKPDWYKQLCANLLDENHLFEFRARVANGEAVGQTLSKTGDVIPMPAGPDTRLQAIRDLEYTAFGRPALAVHMTGSVKVSLSSLVRRAREQRGLAAK